MAPSWFHGTGWTRNFNGSLARKFGEKTAFIYWCRGGGFKWKVFSKRLATESGITFENEADAAADLAVELANIK